MSKSFHARKRFGQHFLVDVSVLQQLLAAINPQAGETILEIGPGQGVLTRQLLIAGVHCTAIELDRDLVAYLNGLDLPRLTVVESDILQVDLSALVEYQPVRCVGNLPYNISTPIIFHCLQHREVIRSMCFLLQKEVVDRLAASPGSKDYGRLSVMVQYHCAVQPVCLVPPEAFDPPPRVNSAVVMLQVRPPQLEANNLQHFSDLVRQAFQMRRKTLRNSLKSVVPDDIWATLSIDPGLRAESLSVNDFVRLSNALQV